MRSEPRNALSLSLVIRVENLVITARHNAHIRTAHQPATATRKHTAQKTTDSPFAKRSKRSDQASTSTTSQPTPITSAENTSASWQPDPILIPTNFVSSGEADIAQMYRQHWPQI